MDYLDEMFSQFSEAFLGNMIGEGDIAYGNNINTSILDYSVISLKEVARYLKTLHQDSSNISDIKYQNTIVWCGAYIGEVIRVNSNIPYHCIHYHEYMKSRDPNLKTMNKIARWIDEGESNMYIFMQLPIFHGLKLAT